MAQEMFAVARAFAVAFPMAATSAGVKVLRLVASTMELGMSTASYTAPVALPV